MEVRFSDEDRSFQMRSKIHMLYAKPDYLVDLDSPFQYIETSQGELKNTWHHSEANNLRAEVLNQKLINDHLFDINRIVETFLIAALLLFVAFEEVDWLFFSANIKNEDLVEDTSSWNIYKLFLFNLV